MHRCTCRLQGTAPYHPTRQSLPPHCASKLSAVSSRQSVCACQARRSGTDVRNRQPRRGCALRLLPEQLHEAMVAKLPVFGETTTASAMAWGFNPYIMERNQFTGAYLMSVGLILPLSTEYTQDFQSRIFHLK